LRKTLGIGVASVYRFLAEVAKSRGATLENVADGQPPVIVLARW